VRCAIQPLYRASLLCVSHDNRQNRRINLHTLLSGVKLSSGLGIPAIDALILASFLMSGAQTIVSTDRHLAEYKEKALTFSPFLDLGPGIL
jgi:hypothetical protein